LLHHLNNVGLPVAAPLPDRQGRMLTLLAGKPAQLAPRLTGQHPNLPDRAQCRAIGNALARLHLGLRDYPLHRTNNHGPIWWNDMATRWLPRLPADDAHLLTRLRSRYAEICARYPDLPQGLIHGDLFRDNTLFRGDAITALLDFSETSRDHWLLDIAITCNDFCRQWPGNAPDAARRAAFLNGYETWRALTAAERAALPVFLAVGAMRFWLSRLDVALRNAEENRSGEHVLEKDPAEMRRLCECLLAEA
jgi:homoserine kinase type II